MQIHNADVPGHALIIGGSMAGLFSGLLLRQLGWQVDIYERADVPLSGRGVGILTHTELFEAMGRVGVDMALPPGISLEARVTVDKDGRVVGTHPLFQVVTSWGYIYHLVRAQYSDEHFHAGYNLERFDQDTDGVTAFFTNGDCAEGDVLIGADGFRSTVRELLMPDLQPVYAGYVLWRGIVNETELSPAAHAALMGQFTFCLPPGEQVLGYPVAGPNDELEPGKTRYNFGWYRPVDPDEGLMRLLTDLNGQVHPISIAPNLVDRENVEVLRTDADRLLAPQFIEVVNLIDDMLLQPIYDVKPESIVFGRVALVGDAAFVARPHVGMGVTKAAWDSLALANAFRDADNNVAAALAMYGPMQSRLGAAVVARGQHLGSYLQSRYGPGSKSDGQIENPSPQWLMTETGTTDFLNGISTWPQ